MSWRRTSQGFYVRAEVTDDLPEQRIVEAAVLLPEYGGVTGWAGLRWCGGAWFDGLGRDGRELLAVPLAIGDQHIRHQPGVLISEEGLPPTMRDAVVALDMAAYNDMVSIEQVRCYAAADLPRAGVIQQREAIGLADENCWSTRETDLRLTWQIDADLPRPLCNVPIFDRMGNLIGTPDILDPVAGVVGEYDGALHLEGAQRARDVRREEMFRRHDLEYFTMLAGDAADRAALIDRMISTRRRARFLAESRRPWTIKPPPWWTPTLTVEQRRALTPADRERLLRLRRQAG